MASIVHVAQMDGLGARQVVVRSPSNRLDRAFGTNGSLGHQPTIQFEAFLLYSVKLLTTLYRTALNQMLVAPISDETLHIWRSVGSTMIAPTRWNERSLPLRIGWVGESIPQTRESGLENYSAHHEMQ